MAEFNEELDIFIPFTQEDQYYDLNFDHIPSSYVIAERNGWDSFESEQEAIDPRKVDSALT